MTALRQVKERDIADQRQQQKKAAVVDCSTKGVTHSSHTNRAGNRLERRQKERFTWESLRDQRTIAQTLENSLNATEGGSDSRNLALTGKLQLLQQICGMPSDCNGNLDPVMNTSLEYVGIVPQLPDRVDDYDKKGQENKEKGKKKVTRMVEDGLLMVVSARIFGRKIQTLIDSGATICFVSPTCVTASRLKGVPHDILLELGNGEKIISKGYIPDVPVVTAGLTVKIGLTVTTPPAPCGSRAWNELA